MNTELQRLRGENKVLRDLLKSARDVLNEVLDDNDMTSDEWDSLDGLVNQIDTALGSQSPDLLEAKP